LVVDWSCRWQKEMGGEDDDEEMAEASKKGKKAKKGKKGKKSKKKAKEGLKGCEATVDPWFRAAIKRGTGRGKG
jgi:hypothetical protein